MWLWTGATRRFVLSICLFFDNDPCFWYICLCLYFPQKRKMGGTLKFLLCWLHLLFKKERRSFENNRSSRLTLFFLRRAVPKSLSWASESGCEQKQAWNENSLFLNKTFQMLSKLWMCCRSCQSQYDHVSFQTQSHKSFTDFGQSLFFSKLSLKEKDITAITTKESSRIFANEDKCMDLLK